MILFSSYPHPTNFFAFHFPLTNINDTIMGNSLPHNTPAPMPSEFDKLPRELHAVIGSFLIGSRPVRIDQILGYILVSKEWAQTILSGPIRLIAFNKHRVSIDALERIGAFERLAFCLDLRFCQPLGADKDFLEIMQYNNIYELDIRGIDFKYDINPDLGHLTSLRRLAISYYSSKPPTAYNFISGLTRLNSLIIERAWHPSDTQQQLDLTYLLPLTNLKELAVQPFNEYDSVIRPITKLISLKTLILNYGFRVEISDLDPADFTVLTNLKVLNIRGLEFESQNNMHKLKNVKWQTSLERIIYPGGADLAKYNPIWVESPTTKYKVGETIVMDVFNSDHKCGFY